MFYTNFIGANKFTTDAVIYYTNAVLYSILLVTYYTILLVSYHSSTILYYSILVLQCTTVYISTILYYIILILSCTILYHTGSSDTDKQVFGSVQKSDSSVYNGSNNGLQNYASILYSKSFLFGGYGQSRLDLQQL
uniref:Uncharacterized protein n=1 Tax=Glossina austeni TaxID=7395 RepID=A0A1A9UDT9_GLOAU